MKSYLRSARLYLNFNEMYTKERQKGKNNQNSPDNTATFTILVAKAAAV